MPRDDWANARQRDIGRRVSREINREEAHLHYKAFRKKLKAKLRRSRKGRRRSPRTQNPKASTTTINGADAQAQSAKPAQPVSPMPRNPVTVAT
jgi:hypothetical protein